MKRIVLIGDIVLSRKLENRAQVQRNLKRVLKKINKEGRHLVSNFTITLGDEFQAVYSKADNLFDDIWQIMSALYPVKIRISIGTGQITTPINKELAIGMDGPAFYNARSGMEIIKKSVALFNLIGFEKGEETLVNSGLELMSHVIYGWNENKFKIMQMLRSQKSKKEIAKKIKISERAVYKAIQSGALLPVRNMASGIEKLINNAIK